jgi:hypothetical protein
MDLDVPDLPPSAERRSQPSVNGVVGAGPPLPAAAAWPAALGSAQTRKAEGAGFQPSPSHSMRIERRLGGR